MDLLCNTLFWWNWKEQTIERYYDDDDDDAEGKMTQLDYLDEN